MYSETLTDVQAEEKIKIVLLEITEMLNNKKEKREADKGDGSNDDIDCDVLIKMKRYVCCFVMKVFYLFLIFLIMFLFLHSQCIQSLLFLNCYFNYYYYFCCRFY